MDPAAAASGNQRGSRDGEERELTVNERIERRLPKRQPNYVHLWVGGW